MIGFANAALRVCVCGCERDSLVASVSLTVQNKAAALMLPSLPSLLNPPEPIQGKQFFFFFPRAHLDESLREASGLTHKLGEGKQGRGEGGESSKQANGLQLMYPINLAAQCRSESLCRQRIIGQL